MHHDDWNNFLVDAIRVEPADITPNNRQPLHVVIEGDTQRIDFDNGEFIG